MLFTFYTQYESRDKHSPISLLNLISFHLHWKASLKSKTATPKVTCSSTRLRCLRLHVPAEDWDAEGYRFERTIEMSEVTCSSGRRRCRKFHNRAHDWYAEGYMFKWTTEMSKIICSSARLRCRRFYIQAHDWDAEGYMFERTTEMPEVTCLSALGSLWRHNDVIMMIIFNNESTNQRPVL